MKNKKLILSIHFYYLCPTVIYKNKTKIDNDMYYVTIYNMEQNEQRRNILYSHKLKDFKIKNSTIFKIRFTV